MSRACAERGPVWAGCLVGWRIDNSAFQLSVAKSRSRAERLNDIIRDIMYLQLKYGFVLDTSWIASEDNILPDDLSRDADSGHGEEAFLAAHGTLAEFLAPGATLQRHPQAGRVVTFADHAHLAREASRFVPMRPSVQISSFSRGYQRHFSIVFKGPRSRAQLCRAATTGEPIRASMTTYCLATWWRSRRMRHSGRLCGMTIGQWHSLGYLNRLCVWHLFEAES